MRTLVACTLLASLLLLVPTSSAQAEAKLQAQLQGHLRDPETAFKSGRVAPLTDVNLEQFLFSVQAPSLSYCADAQVRMEYNVKEWTPIQVHRPESETRRLFGTGGDQVSVGESSGSGYSANLRVWVDETAVAFTSHEVMLLAQAVPTQAFPACNFAPSDPVQVSTVLVVDYAPKLEVRVPPEPWGDTTFLLEAENLGNGDSRVGFAFGTARGEWVPLGVTHVLETPIDGKAVSKRVFELNRLDAPLGWTGEVLVSMTSVQYAADVAKSQQIVDLGTPPPLAYPDETTDPTDDTKGADGALETLPGWGGFGTALALSLGLFVRRRRVL